MTQPNQCEDVREQLRNLSAPLRSDSRYPIHAYEDDLVQLIEELNRVAFNRGLVWATEYLTNQKYEESTNA